MPWNIRTRFDCYIEPWEPLWYALWALYMSARSVISEGRYLTLLSPQKLKDTEFYLWFKELNDSFINFERTQTAVPKLVAQSSGVVLELGPGAGNQLSQYNKDKVTRIIGVEPNPHFAPDIEQQIHKQGLENIYELVIASAEDSKALERHGIVTESLDTVLSIQVLCSVSDPESLVKELYRLLKPGGKFIFWEHHRNSDRLSSIVQQTNWGCNMNRDIKGIIAAAGEWENGDSIEGDELPQSLLPRAWGELVKVRNVGA
ncbi:Thiol S-methyltransferase TMT1B [Cladobotryum mycophilum]|uniref:Thiol S-methyltransferase TMT1B n=1 Tax=Cladobotryum mycophilum TaxID=491253 RepID=A0ABR0SWC6_9HYPO